MRVKQWREAEVRVNTDIAGQFSAVRDYEIGKTVVKL
jgi:hypothetical protein